MRKGVPYIQLSHRSFILPIWSSCMTMYALVATYNYSQVCMAILCGYIVDQLQPVIATCLCCLYSYTQLHSSTHAYISQLYSNNVTSLLLWLQLTYSLIWLPSLPSMLPSLLYTATLLCLPSLYYNSLQLYVAQSAQPTQSAQSTYVACLWYCLLCLLIAVYLVWSTWLATLLCLSILLIFLQPCIPTQ